MIIDAYRFGPPPTGTVTYISDTGAEFIASGMSITSPVTPAGILDNDGLFAVVFGRSALTPPAGWTLVESQSNTGSVTQTLYVYRKNTVTSADSSTSFSWDQAVNGRMGLAYLVCRSDTGTITVAESDGAETDGTGAYPHSITIPVLTADTSGELFLVAMTTELATAGIDTWTAPSGLTFRTEETQASNRMVAGTQARNSGQSNATPAAFAVDGGGSGDNYYSAITVRLQA